MHQLMLFRFFLPSVVRMTRKGRFIIGSEAKDLMNIHFIVRCFMHTRSFVAKLLWMTKWGISYRITYTSATEIQALENQCIPVADTLKSICHICHDSVADDRCPLQMVCHRNPLNHSAVCLRCRVAEIIEDDLVLAQFRCNSHRLFYSKISSRVILTTEGRRNLNA